jgi:coenzyme F420-dependent glucose-6-phosphate dehydrogenase
MSSRKVTQVKLAWLCSHESYQPEVLVEHAVLAERAGFDVITGADHFHPWVDDHAAASFVWAWFGAVAAATTKVELATSVTAPLYRYHPALIAQAAATVDRLSGGRFILGVGTGEAINEIPLGHQFPAYSERIARMSEAITILQGLLAGEKLDINGQYYQVRVAKLYSPPVRHVPVWMAAGGPKSAVFAGRHADGLITSVKDAAHSVAAVIDPYRQAAADRGVKTTVMATRWVVLADNDDMAWEALTSMRGLRAPGRLDVADPMVLRERADAMDRRDILSKYMIVRDLEQLMQAYRPLVRAIGADYVAIQVASVDPVTTIQQIGADVLPALRESA